MENDVARVWRASSRQAGVDGEARDSDAIPRNSSKGECNRITKNTRVNHTDLLAQLSFNTAFPMGNRAKGVANKSYHRASFMPLFSTQLSSSPRLQKAVNNAPPVSVGESNEGVAAMQQGLIDLGFDMPISTTHGAKSPDGIYGAETGKVLRRFQQQQGLTADGLAGTNTLTRMDALLLSQESYSAVAENAAIAAQMAGLHENRPFATTTARRA